MFGHSVPERDEKLVQKPGLLTAKLILDWGGTDAITRKSKEARKDYKALFKRTQNKVPLWANENNLKLDCGDGCPTLKIYQTNTELYT